MATPHWTSFLPEAGDKLLDDATKVRAMAEEIAELQAAILSKKMHMKEIEAVIKQDAAAYWSEEEIKKAQNDAAIEWNKDDS